MARKRNRLFNFKINTNIIRAPGGALTLPAILSIQLSFLYYLFPLRRTHLSQYPTLLDVAVLSVKVPRIAHCLLLKKITAKTAPIFRYHVMVKLATKINHGRIEMQTVKSALAVATIWMMIAQGVTAATQEDRYAISRYTTIDTTPEVRQSNPLLTVVSFSFPPTVETVGQAINYTIQQTGYTLAEMSNLPESTKVMLTLPLPSVQRKFSYVTVQAALKTLAGDAFLLLVDPVHRVVTFVPLLHDADPSIIEDNGAQP